MKRIVTTFSQKWPEYLLEILVITIGILGAFALNNWNENRKAQGIEKQILKNLRAEAQLNIDQLRYAMSMHDQSFKSSVELLKLFGKDVSNIPSQQLDTFMTHMETVWTFEARDGTFKSVISSGNLDYLKNDSLKSMIAALDGQIINAIQETDEIRRLLHERLWPLIDGKINSSSRLIAYGWEMPPGAYASDYQWMFDSREAEDIISNIASWFISIQTDEKMLMDHFEKLLLLINQELQKT